MYVGSLFSGAGLGDIAAEAIGLSHAWFCECDPFARSILERRWPGVPVFHDVRDIHAQNAKRVDIVIGGFPCQDISCAGAGAGITGKRSGLWSEYARILGELRPQFAVVENVKALLGRGIDRVLGDLAEIGYDAEWDVFPAAAFGAPHLRERVILVAYPGGDRGAARAPILAPGGDLENHGQSDGPAHWNGLRLDGPRAPAAISAYRGPVVCRVDDGGAHWMDRLRCLGNGITPPLMRWVLGRIMAAELDRSRP
ncbi:C-5 cytosine-specific DNA methylase [Solidesulfovibrio carbinoliphilus subsp. oakridgensis]|uniref:Cytosine-specific methyltransferase n=1 Tax=Solidesulfovibrio carbinoliphilus subsp. oakridgensis TaxID=694327 RepID=G7Q8T1_9BACT|nr:C-5 cytosine-specific DNA methylase [Solidesulfovibrio carbinoliphilus subsp. oakridgensis]